MMSGMILALTMMALLQAPQSNDRGSMKLPPEVRTKQSSAYPSLGDPLYSSVDQMPPSEATVYAEPPAARDPFHRQKMIIQNLGKRLRESETHIATLRDTENTKADRPRLLKRIGSLLKDVEKDFRVGKKARATLPESTDLDALAKRIEDIYTIAVDIQPEVFNVAIAEQISNYANQAAALSDHLARTEQERNRRKPYDDR
jgi:hypothetical protein